MIEIAAVLVVYAIGVVMGKWTERQNHRCPSEWSNKYVHICQECMPGVKFRFSADDPHHLEQVVRWHKEDYHEGELE